METSSILITHGEGDPRASISERDQRNLRCAMALRLPLWRAVCYKGPSPSPFLSSLGRGGGVETIKERGRETIKKRDHAQLELTKPGPLRSFAA